MKKSIILIITLSFVLLFSEVKVGYLESCPANTQYSSNYAILAGAVTETGGENNVQVWFEWGTNPNNLTNSTPIQNIYVTSLPYRFCYTITNLQPCTTYYYRAGVRNSAGTNYGQTYSFTTRCQPSYQPLTISCYASPNPANVNSLVTFYSVVSGGTGNYFYEWTGSCTSFSSSCQKIFSQPGNYSVTLRVSSGNEVRFTTCSVNVVQSTPTPSPSVNQPPVAVLAFSPERILPGTIVTFDASRSYDPDGYLISYSWYLNNELVSNNISFKRALASGVYRVKLKVTDNQGASSEKEILINVGRNVYLTRTRVVTRTLRFPVQTVSAKLVNLLLDSSYPVKICSSNELEFTLINNTSVHRKINLQVSGEASDWFKPKSKTFILKPYETLLFKWTVDVPCDVKEGDYEATFIVTTPGGRYEETTVLEAKPSGNFLSPLLGLLGGLFSGWNLLWLLLLILIILNIYLWYKVFRKKEAPAS